MRTTTTTRSSSRRPTCPALAYAFGQGWGPGKDAKDQDFRFLPGSGKYKAGNGVYQDGGLVFQHPGGPWLAFFLAFQPQVFKTDANGNPLSA